MEIISLLKIATPKPRLTASTLNLGWRLQFFNSYNISIGTFHHNGDGLKDMEM
jgi:hypothetical protein